MLGKAAELNGLRDYFARTLPGDLTIRNRFLETKKDGATRRKLNGVLCEGTLGRLGPNGGGAREMSRVKTGTQPSTSRPNIDG